MIDDRDDLLREIGAALSIEPTAEFAAKLRADLERQRMATGWRVPVSFAAAVVVLLVAGMVGIRRETPELLPALVPASTPAASAAENAVLVPVQSASPRNPAKRALPVPVRPRPQSEVIVARDEVRAFWRLLEHVQPELVVVPAPWRVSVDTGELDPLPEIAAIAVPDLGVEPLAGAAGAEEQRGGLDD